MSLIDMILLEHSRRRFRNPDVVADRLRHLLHTVESFKQRRRGHDLLRLSVVLLKFPPHQ